MDTSIRVMVERGKKKRTVASAFDWSGWDRSGKIEEDAIRVLESYRPRYAKVAALAGLSDEFGTAGELTVVERLEGIGMTDYYGVSGRSAEPEQDQMTEAECERKVALLRASWTYFDDVAERVSPELQKGPRGGGRDRDDRPPCQRLRDRGVREEGRRALVARRLAGTPTSCTPIATRSARRSARPTPAGPRRDRGGRSNS
jgi:hypothetical protein